jgi:hypothetical protein
MHEGHVETRRRKQMLDAAISSYKGNMPGIFFSLAYHMSTERRAPSSLAGSGVKAVCSGLFRASKRELRLEFQDQFTWKAIDLLHLMNLDISITRRLDREHSVDKLGKGARSLVVGRG